MGFDMNDVSLVSKVPYIFTLLFYILLSVSLKSSGVNIWSRTLAVGLSVSLMLGIVSLSHYIVSPSEPGCIKMMIILLLMFMAPFSIVLFFVFVFSGRESAGRILKRLLR